MRIRLAAGVRTALLVGLVSSGWPAQAAETPGEQRWLHPKCEALPQGISPTTIVLPDGNLLAVGNNVARTSKDDGKTWQDLGKIYDGDKPGIPSSAAQLICTRDGVIVMTYMDMSTYKWKWDDAKHVPIDAELDVWAIRSLDGGKTWVDRQLLMDGYCGALIDMIETKSGHVVAQLQDLYVKGARHVTLCGVSADKGKTWKLSNLVDLPGRGHHDGALEVTLAEVANGRVMMLIRTNFDRFWKAYSDDHGLTWQQLQPTDVAASTSPGYLLRLKSGRLALIWNRLCPEGETKISRSPNINAYANAPTWYRAELSLAFSTDDAQTWSKPVVIARQPGGQLAYPCAIERRPGELWVFTRFSFDRARKPAPLAVRLKEADFVSN